jgi:hypothetical protein
MLSTAAIPTLPGAISVSSSSPLGVDIPPMLLARADEVRE